jgi:hypothetical protein
MSGPFDDLTETQRQQIREAHAANKEREMRAEPHCNHDPAAVHDGICECGTITGPCTECGATEVAGEINMEAVCEDCAAELNAAGEGIALDFIAAQLHGWTDDSGDSGDILGRIVAITRGTGREVRDSNHEPDDHECGLQDSTGEDAAR